MNFDAVVGAVVIVLGLVFMVSNFMIGSKVMAEAEQARQEALEGN